MKKYTAKLKGKLNGNNVTIEIPVTMDIEEQLRQKAIEKATAQGLTSVELLDLGDLQSEYVQMSIPFDYDYEEDEEDEMAEDQQFDEETSTYTAYSSMKQKSDQQDCQSDSQTETRYTPYGSLNKKSEAISFIPRINDDAYVPYKTKIVPISQKYLNFKFK